MAVYKVKVQTVTPRGVYIETVEVSVPDGADPRECGEDYCKRYSKRIRKYYSGKTYKEAREVIEVLGITEGEGIDRYGKFWAFTGHEAKGRCFWCGVKTSHGARYCCSDHQKAYLRHFWWPEASEQCARKAWDGAAYKCQDCGECLTFRHDTVVHHIQPLPEKGRLRQWNILNRPENLVLICTKCHGLRHRQLRVKEAEREISMIRRQLMFSFEEER